MLVRFMQTLLAASDPYLITSKYERLSCRLSLLELQTASMGKKSGLDG
jgi:hypothetical protein